MIKSFMAVREVIEKIGESLRQPVFIPTIILVGVNLWHVFPWLSFKVSLFSTQNEADSTIQNYEMIPSIKQESKYT